VDPIPVLASSTFARLEAWNSVGNVMR
jgi:hypothetical protein